MFESQPSSTVVTHRVAFIGLCFPVTRSMKNEGARGSRRGTECEGKRWPATSLEMLTLCTSSYSPMSVPGAGGQACDGREQPTRAISDAYL